MAKPRDFIIKESVSELKSLRKNQSKFKYKVRLIWLESIVTNRFKTRKELSDYLDITPKTSERWTLKYIANGIEGLLSDAPKVIRSRIITPEIHKGLEAKLHSSTDPFLGYWDAQNWVNQMEEETIKSITGNHHYLNAFKATFNV